MDFLCLIPSRYASSRFPGKPLANLGGKSMVRRVYEQAAQALQNVAVATDDERIATEVRQFGGTVVMTSPAHRSGTDRCAEAARKLLTNPADTVIINIQGDEPFIRTRQLEQLKRSFKSPETQIATLVKKAASEAEIFDPNKPKVVLNCRNQAIYFSRSPIPFVRGVPQNQWLEKHTFFTHIGIYAYRYEILKKITQLAPSKLETAESLEQNRWIENGFTIKTELTDYQSIGIDTPADLEKARLLLKQFRAEAK